MRELTAEERERIARNKEEALKRAAARKAREAAAAGNQIPDKLDPITATLPKSLQSKQPFCGSSGMSNPMQQSNITNQNNRSVISNNSNVVSNTKSSAIPPAVLATMPRSLQKENTYAAQSRINTFTKPATSTSSLSHSAQLAPVVSSSAHLSTSSHPVKIAPVFAQSAQARTTISCITVTFKIYTSERFKILMQPFNASVVHAIKNIPSRYYDEKDRTWSIRFTEMKQLEAALSALKDVDCTVNNIPPDVLKLLADEKLETIPSNLFVMIDPSLVNVLFPYQKGGVVFALERRGRVLIADEMGLGKSLQAITVARYYRSEWPVLIVCPSSVKHAWKTQFNTFLPVITKIFVIEKGSDPLPDCRTSNTVVITSYEQMVLKHKELSKLAYQVIILDECHLLKDSKAKRTQVATDLARIANRVIMLSGTPALSRPAELFSQIRIVNPKLFPNYHQFATRYCDGKQGRFCFEAKGCTNSEELAAILMKKVMIRRLKNDVLKDLPDKRREVVYLSGDSIDVRMDGLMKAKKAFERHTNPDNSGGNESLLEYFSMTGIVKAAAVSSHILDNYFYTDAPPRKVLIFGHHQIVLDTITVEVQKRNLKCIRIDGSTPSHKRGEYCKSFQEDPSVMVAVLSVTSAGVGITLTAATVVVFAELHWNPGTLLQAEDRAHRVGQKDSVFVQYLVARNTADDIIWNMIQKKLDILGQVNLSSDTFRDAEKTHMAFDDRAPRPDISDYFLEPKKKKPAHEEEEDDWS